MKYRCSASSEDREAIAVPPQRPGLASAKIVWNCRTRSHMGLVCWVGPIHLACYGCHECLLDIMLLSPPSRTDFMSWPRSPQQKHNVTISEACQSQSLCRSPQARGASSPNMSLWLSLSNQHFLANEAPKRRTKDFGATRLDSARVRFDTTL